MPIEAQVEYFREYKERLEGVMGKQRTKNHIKNTVFFISAGTNDFVITYFNLPLRRKTFTLSAYQHFIIQQISQFFQVLLLLLFFIYISLFRRSYCSCSCRGTRDVYKLGWVVISRVEELEMYMS